MNSADRDSWLADSWTTNEIRSYRIRRTLCQTDSKYQKIAIYDLYDKGVSLVLGNHARVFEIDEFIFHEGFAHFTMARSPTPRSVLVIGDGDGGLVRELLKYPEVHLDWVEIDPDVVSCCERYLPTFPHGFRQDGRTQLHPVDGARFLRETTTRYDAIFISITVGDEETFASDFWKHDTHRVLRSLVNDDGVISISLDEYSPATFNSYLSKVSSLQERFPNVIPYSIPLPSFGSNWGFALVSCGTAIAPRFPNISNLRYYNDIEDERMRAIPSYLAIPTAYAVAGKL